jgi:TPP-dependent pyruvate/acetoin dehydrogenase alpha subunit
MAQTKAVAPSTRLEAELARRLLSQMELIRRFEEKAAEMYALGKIGGFLHLYIGQEAVAVGAMSMLRPDDYAIASYREHGHCLAKGADPGRAMPSCSAAATGSARARAARCTSSTRA